MGREVNGGEYDVKARVTFSSFPIVAGPFASIAYTSSGDYYITGVSASALAAGLSSIETLYYSNQWQVIQDDTQASVGATPQVADQYVWGQAYVNELVLRDNAVSGTSGNLGIAGSGLSQRIYAIQDANWNVVALTDSTGYVNIRYTYDPYGNVSQSGGLTTLVGPLNWAYMFQGGRLDATTGLYKFENRDYSPTMATWVEEDPEQYVEGSDLYQLENSDPVNHLDPAGTSSYYQLRQELSALLNKSQQLLEKAAKTGKQELIEQAEKTVQLYKDALDYLDEITGKLNEFCPFYA